MLTVIDVSSRLHLPVSWQIHLKNKWMFISEDILTPTSNCHLLSRILTTLALFLGSTSACSAILYCSTKTTQPCPRASWLPSLFCQ